MARTFVMPGKLPRAACRRKGFARALPGLGSADRHADGPLWVESRRLPSAPPTQRGSDGTGHWVCGRLTDHIDDRSFGRRRGPRIEPIAATKRCHHNCDRTQSTSLHLIPALAITQNCLSSPTIRSFAEWCGRPLPSILLLPPWLTADRQREKRHEP